MLHIQHFQIFDYSDTHSQTTNILEVFFAEFQYFQYYERENKTVNFSRRKCLHNYAM